MPTLAQLQINAQSGTTDAKLKGAMDIANFMLLYNEEYNMLLRLQAAVKVAHYRVTHNEDGVDQVRRMQLEALRTQIIARKSMLDLKMMAIYNGKVEIDPPSQATIDEVKELSKNVAADVQRDKAINDILKTIAQIAKLVDGAMPDPD